MAQHTGARGSEIPLPNGPCQPVPHPLEREQLGKVFEFPRLTTLERQRVQETDEVTDAVSEKLRDCRAYNHMAQM